MLSTLGVAKGQSPKANSSGFAALGIKSHSLVNHSGGANLGSCASNNCSLNAPKTLNSP